MEGKTTPGKYIAKAFEDSVWRGEAEIDLGTETKDKVDLIKNYVIIEQGVFPI